MSTSPWLDAVRADGWALKRVPTEERTPEVCLTAVTHNGLALQFVPPLQRTEGVCTAAVHQNPWALTHVPKCTPTILTAAMEERYINIPKRDAATGAMVMQRFHWGFSEKRMRTATAHVPQTLDNCLAMVRSNPWSITVIKRQSPAVCCAAIAIKPLVYRDLRPDARRNPEIALSAVTGDGDMLEHVPPAALTPDVCAAAVASKPCALRWVPAELQTPQLVGAAVSKDGAALIRVKDVALITPELAHTAVASNGWALQGVPADMITTALCEVAVASKPDVITVVPPALLTPELAMAAVRGCGMTLRHIPDAMRTDALCLAAIHASGAFAMRHVPERCMSTLFP